MTVKGKDFIWEGQLLSDMNSFSRDDQMVPKDVMKRVKFLSNNGLEFEDGFSLFWPQKTYEPGKESIADHQIDRLKDDLSMLATKTGNALKSGFGLIGSAARTGRNAIGTAFEVGRGMADVSTDNLANNLRTGVQVHDPVLAGVIAGSLARKRYFLIEVGRWIDTY